MLLPGLTARCNLSLYVYWIREANRRWSMALSSMGHSQASAQSLQSIAGDADRKISFVLHEPENESEGSSNATVNFMFNLLETYICVFFNIRVQKILKSKLFILLVGRWYSGCRRKESKSSRRNSCRQTVSA